MVLSDSLQTFDSFLNGVTQMQDAVSQFDLDLTPVEPETKAIDSDIIKLSVIYKLEISSPFEDSDSLGSESDSDVEQPTSHPFGLQWLRSQLQSISSSSSMDIEDLYSTVLGVITSDSSDEELQSSLPDILGFEHLEMVIELISHRSSIQESVSYLKFFSLIFILITY